MDKLGSRLHRALIIFNRLVEGPASKPALLALLKERTPDAYLNLTRKVEGRKFENDLDKLRHGLGATVLYERSRGIYVLTDAGPLLSLSLSAESLRGLALILEITEDNPDARAVTRPLLDTLESVMQPDQQRQLERAAGTLRVDLRKLDEGEIVPAVWERIRFAREYKRQVRFYYQSPNQPEGEPRLHIVEPHDLRFERGHFYLRGYCVEWRNPQGMTGGGSWINYRLDHILADDLEVTPTSIKPRAQRRIRIKYKVAPRLWRGGLSRRFKKMEIVEVDEDGWAVVSAETDDLFYARQVLLRYGALVVALSPARLVDEMRDITRAMAAAYADD